MFLILPLGLLLELNTFVVRLNVHHISILFLSIGLVEHFYEDFRLNRSVIYDHGVYHF